MGRRDKLGGLKLRTVEGVERARVAINVVGKKATEVKAEVTCARATLARKSQRFYYHPILRSEVMVKERTGTNRRTPSMVNFV
jgi:hypothetical protein